MTCATMTTDNNELAFLKLLSWCAKLNVTPPDAKEIAELNAFIPYCSKVFKDDA